MKSKAYLKKVTILREFHNWQNIIKFHGLTNDGKKWYLVITEWAEHGNLREFYINNKDSFDPKLKLRISLDIAYGLNFLRTVESNYNQPINIEKTFKELCKEFDNYIIGVNSSKFILRLKQNSSQRRS
ncbi:hypothetical protein RhiirA1_542321 [Rhizophagus irregularis]|uniref:Serine-threonine/tyrosine-protein kinase catalytic domain-containing protein n=1 Tax=Rhizophagus irregularis TaxID=588596 RepID=A0A2N0QXV3_9GLOM|nr:hypothetical protein RhiirA1_542321 [Rhizophagus irregularis]